MLLHWDFRSIFYTKSMQLFKITCCVDLHYNHQYLFNKNEGSLSKQQFDKVQTIFVLEKILPILYFQVKLGDGGGGSKEGEGNKWVSCKGCNHSREGVIIKCPQNDLFYDCRDVIITSQMANSQISLTVAFNQNFRTSLLFFTKYQSNRLTFPTLL